MQEKDKDPIFFTITNKTKLKRPKVSFSNIKDEVLGTEYSLSLVFIGDDLSQKINKNYRNKNEPTSILSFPLSEYEGEVFINLKKAQRDSSDFLMTFDKFVAYLFIHGMLHLKGMQHSSTMYKREKDLLKCFFD